jgi:hypothetical protein
MKFLDKIPFSLLVVACLTLGLAPFNPPHLSEKIQMLLAGGLTRPIDIFDLLLHASPFIVMLAKSVRMLLTKR